MSVIASQLGGGTLRCYSCFTNKPLTNPVLKQQEGGEQVLQRMFFLYITDTSFKRTTKKAVSESTVSSSATWRETNASLIAVLAQSAQRFRRSLNSARIFWHLPLFAEQGLLFWIHLRWQLAAFVLLSPDISFLLLEVQFLYYNQ